MSAYIEENALHMAALAYARAQFHPLEIRMRVDLAQKVLFLLGETNPITDRVVFSREELDDAFDLARVTLLHAGEKDLSTATAQPTHVLSLLLQARLIVRNAQGRFSTNEGAVNAALRAFGELIALLSSCSRMPGEPECRRDGDCPEHGKNRPGQCVPEEKPKAESQKQKAPGSGT